MLKILRIKTFLFAYLVCPFLVTATNSMNNLVLDAPTHLGNSNFIQSAARKKHPSNSGKHSKKTKFSDSIQITGFDFGELPSSGSFFVGAFSPLVPLPSVGLPPTFTSPTAVIGFEVPGNLNTKKESEILVKFFTGFESSPIINGNVSFTLSADIASVGQNIPGSTTPPLSRILGSTHVPIESALVSDTANFYVAKILLTKNFFHPGQFIYLNITRNVDILNPDYEGSVFIVGLELNYEQKN